MGENLSLPASSIRELLKNVCLLCFYTYYFPSVFLLTSFPLWSSTQVFSSRMDRDLILSFTKEMFDMNQFEQVSIIPHQQDYFLQDQRPTLLMLLCVSLVVLTQFAAVSGAALLHGGLCKPTAGSGAAGWSDFVQSSASHWWLHGFWEVPIDLHWTDCQVRAWILFGKTTQ